MLQTLIQPTVIQNQTNLLAKTHPMIYKHIKHKSSIGLKCVFLDIDGVLNNIGTTELCSGFVGIDEKNLFNFSKLINNTNAMVILTSTWREYWEKNDKNKQDIMANYLDEKLAKYNIKITDKTYDKYNDRGMGILKSIEKYNIKRYVILDDIFFSDYSMPQINSHLVLTDELVGLTEKNVYEAIKILNGCLRITS